MKDSISRFIDKLAAYEALIRYLIRGVITIRPSMYRRRRLSGDGSN